MDCDIAPTEEQCTLGEGADNGRTLQTWQEDIYLSTLVSLFFVCCEPKIAL